MKRKIIIVMCCLVLIVTQKGFAQLKGTDLLGAAGLDAGTQAPPQTFTLFIPAYFYNTSSLNGINGNKLNNSPNLNMFLTGIGGTVTTNFKILGGTYGATLLLPFIKNEIQGNNINSKSSLAFSDTYVEPLQLGWSTKTADFSFNYGLYLPTGSYSYGGDDNSGLGITASEFSAGTTIRLDPKGTINFSSLFAYELNSDKKGTDIKPGDIFTATGGLGKTWYSFNGTKVPTSIIKAGIVYYMQFKTTPDQIPLPAQDAYFLPGEDHIYSLGLEGNILLTKSRMLLGVRWFDEFDAVNRFQGNTFFITVAHVFDLSHAKAN